MNNSFSSYVKSYFTTYLTTTKHLSENSIISYKYDMLSFIEYLKIKKYNLNKLMMEEITYEIIEGYIVWLKEEKNNIAISINRKIINLKSFFKYVRTKDLNYLEISEKINEIAYMKVNKTIPRYLDRKEIEYMLNIVKDNLKYYLIIVMLFETGMRVSSLCNLKVENIQDEKTHATINVLKDKNSSERIIPISTEVYLLIKKHLQNEGINEGYIFLNRYNNQYKRNGIYKIVNKIYQIAKSKCNDKTLFMVDKISPHGLRHSKAMNLLNNEVSLIEIRDFLGHKHLSTTEHYARINDKKRNEIILNESLSLPKNMKRTKKEKNDLETFLRDFNK